MKCIHVLKKDTCRCTVKLRNLRNQNGIFLSTQSHYCAYMNFDHATTQLIRFAKVSSHVADFNTRNTILTAKLLKQGYRYHKLRKTFSKFYRRHYDLVSKFNAGLKYLFKQGLPEPEFYGDLVYKLRKIVSRNDFSDRIRKIKESDTT